MRTRLTRAAASTLLIFACAGGVEAASSGPPGPNSVQAFLVIGKGITERTHLPTVSLTLVNTSTTAASFTISRITLFVGRNGIVVPRSTESRIDAPFCGQRIDLKPEATEDVRCGVRVSVDSYTLSPAWNFESMGYDVTAPGNYTVYARIFVAAQADANEKQISFVQTPAVEFDVPWKISAALPGINSIELERTGSAAFIHAVAKRDSIYLTTCVCDRSGHVHGYAYFAPTEPVPELFSQLQVEAATFSPNGYTGQSPLGVSPAVIYKISVSNGVVTRTFEVRAPVVGQLTAWDSQIVAEFTRLLAILQRRMKPVEVASRSTQRNPS